MALLPKKQDSQTVQAIYALRERRKSIRPAQTEISIFNHPCARYKWNVFRWVGDAWTDPAIGAGFPIGRSDEVEILQEIKQIVSQFFDVDPQTNKPIMYTEAGGHIYCAMPAAALGFPEAPKTWHVILLEFYSSEQFAQVQANGCADYDANTYLRAQFLMHKSGMDRAILIGCNIDNNHLLAERIHADVNAHKNIAQCAIQLVDQKKPPSKISEKQDHEKCKVCVFQNYCFGNAIPQATCRTCRYVDPVGDVQNQVPIWRCARHKRQLTTDQQMSGCDDHLYIAMTINGAAITTEGHDEAGDWVQYRKPDGVVFVNSKQQGAYKSAELARMPFDMIGNPTIQNIKNAVGGTVTEVDPNIVCMVS